MKAYIIILNKPIKWTLILSMSNMIITSDNIGKIILKSGGKFKQK